MTRHKLPGSERELARGARILGKADPGEKFEVTVLLRGRNGEVMHEHVRKLAKGDRSVRHVRREEFAEQFGAEARDIDAVKTFAKEHKLAVAQEDAARRTVRLSGTVRQFNEAFGVDLQRVQHDSGSYRGRSGPVTVPDPLKDVVRAVLGLDNRPVAKPHFRVRPQPGGLAPRAASGTFTPPQLAQLYNFPQGEGSGQCIALIELGGGYNQDDLQTYFSELSISPVPSVTAVSVDQGANQPTGDPNGPDGEVMLDIEVAGAVAPQANIAVYFAPNTDAGFLDAITTAIHDTTNKPTVISISWGGPESNWTQQAMTSFDEAFQSAAAMGITVCAASGDNGSSDGASGDNVDFPASSPHCLACGGTSLDASGGAISSETVWDNGSQGGASGGGVSTMFALPTWQANLQVTRSDGSTQPLQMRGVPDVSGDADPQTGYDVRVDGSDTVIGGTSAVAPLWAALIARINSADAATNPVGLPHPTLYANPSALRDITQGNNGDFAASPGWDACTGLGSPNGTAVAGLFGQAGQTGQTGQPPSA